ncbi:acyl-CoA dehydrogenase family protein [Streptomyces sp. H27-D2]|uniref:acyl-CoA dehydrogenase family protein n=1 Tax=Streptomyces sp. H27-D2 TaxID=3046304 RepID=UPI002DBA7309|nr:acyl-CoA dehydrogenase family protein [Streptomyces sp. H27-D2]MEC4015351.1 acyl-CoA dehydrogenase family protein [Streptomyces sp. H27-D2]
MDAAFTEEQDEIRRTLRELLLKRCGPDEVKAAARTAAGYDEELWRRLAEQLGLPGLAVSAEYGGVGCGATELALACEETGRVLLPSPLIATAALVAPLIAALGTAAQRAALLPRITSGELTGALAVPGAVLSAALGLTGGHDGGWAGGGRAGGVQARAEAGGWRLYGEADQVLDGHSAGLLLVAAHTGGYARSRTLIFVVRPEAGTGAGTEAEKGAERQAGAEAGAVGAGACAGGAGLVRTRLTALDETRPQARIELRDAPAELLGASDELDVSAALAAVGAGAAAALAAEAVGAADRALSRTVEYVRSREQFGRPIGSFQAVQHRLADLYVQVQVARSAAYYAAWSAGAGDSGADSGGAADANGANGANRASGSSGSSGTGRAATSAEVDASRRAVGGLALAQALEALRAVAGEAVQLHGGIGFTWEHDAHLAFKRAASDELLFGPVQRLRAHAAEQSGLFGSGTGESQEARAEQGEGQGQGQAREAVSG